MRSALHDLFSRAPYRCAMLHRLVVPLDGSPCAQHALSYALRVAKAEGAELAICSAVDAFAILGRNVERPLDEPPVAAAAARAQRLVDDAAAQAAAAGVRASVHVAVGEPAASLVAYASQHGADTIVMGTHGQSGFRRLAMGSVAAEVLRSAPCPVVVVREKAPLEAAHAPPSASDRDGQPVYVLRLVEVAPEDFERLYGEIASFMQGPGSELRGVLESHVLGSEDSRRIAILAQFSSHADWISAQWDARLSELLEEIVVNSETLEFNLYRGDRFRGAALRR